MTPTRFLTDVLDPGLDWLAGLGGPAPTDPARVFLLAVAGQESNWSARYQGQPAAAPGPARGYWQFERGGGVRGVLTHARSRDLAASCCRDIDVAPTADAVWRALEGGDMLATAFARLLLWTDPGAIPTTQAAAWDCYAKRLWRPGKPHPERWPKVWTAAMQAVERVAA